MGGPSWGLLLLYLAVFDVIVVGGGIYGALLSRGLSFYQGRVLLLEKESDVGNGASGANSAIIHSGYDPLPGTKKALYNVRGNAMFPGLCRLLDVDLKKFGSLTVSFDEEGNKKLEELKKRADTNGVEAKIIGQPELGSMEPSLSDKAMEALYCPSAYIVDPFTLTAHAMENAIDNGVELHLLEEVVHLEKKDGHYLVRTNNGEYESRAVVLLAGGHNEVLLKELGEEGYGGKARKGEYYVLDHFNPNFLKHVLFPIPTSKGKGVLVTPTTSGNYLVGPSSEFTSDYEEVSTDELTLKEVKRMAQELVPSLPFNEQIRVYAGTRATSEKGDFIVGISKENPGLFHLSGIDSPGLASAPALCEDLVKEIVSYLGLKKKDSYQEGVKPYYRPLKMSQEEREKFYLEHPKYTKIVCACEKVSLGEVEDVLSRSLPCLSLKALKKRTRAGFGKCQGGFCGPNLMPLIAKKLGIKEGEVLYDKAGSEVSVMKVRKDED